ncbi:unnamed protein product, partial [Medioppia subpectinata]
NNHILIESLESQYKTIITDGCAQHSTQTTTTHNWPLDTQTTPVGHRSETITTEDQSMTAEYTINDGQIETDTGSDGCVATNTETIHIMNESVIKREKEDMNWSPLSVMKYSTYNKPKRQKPQQTARKSFVSSPPKTSFYICDWMGCVDTFITKSLLDNHRKVNHKIDVPFGARLQGWRQQVADKADRLTDPSTSLPLKPFACDYKDCHFRAVNQSILDSHREYHKSVDLQYSCDYDDCHMRFAAERSLTIHRRTSGHFVDNDILATPGPPYGCQWPDCTKTFNTMWKLKRHVDGVHTNVRPFECHDCPKRFLSNSDLCTHRREKHSLEPIVPKKVFKCDYNDCQYETTYSGTFSEHKKRHLNIKKFVCEETDCAASFVTNGDLKRHMRSHSDERPHRCDWPGCEMAYKKTESLVDHRRRHTGDLPFLCDDCEERFPSNNSLTEHRRRRHDTKRYECAVNGCSWATNTRSEFIVHRGKHQNVGQFVCKETDCGKSFVLKSRLKKHMVCHSDEKPYRCDWPGCESAYKWSTALDQHRRKHSGNREYKCPFEGCGKSFMSCNNLWTHRNIHKQPYVCHWPECDQRFGDSRRLKSHMNEHQGIRPHKCHFSGCDKSYFGKPSLNAHLKAVHKLILIESLETQYKTIITDGCAQYKSLTADYVESKGPIETDTGVERSVDTNEEIRHTINENEIKVEEDMVWDPLSVMKYSTYNKPKRQRVQTARKSCMSSPPKTSKVYQPETSPLPKTSLYVYERTGHQYRCAYDDCGRSFMDEKSLKTHQHLSGHFDDTDDMAIPGPPYGCQWPDCTKDFKTTWMLKRHVSQVHTCVRPFECHDCPKRFVANRDLKRHMSVHSDEWPHRCDWTGCKSAFKKADSLADHRRRHSGDLPFACDDCEEKFPSISSLNSHRRRRHDTKRYECDVSGCSWATNTRSQFDVHRRKHQNVRPFVCEETDCGKSFHRKWSLTKHMQCHSDERPHRCDWP